MPPLPVSTGVSYIGYLNEYASLTTSPLPTIIPRDASGKPGEQLSAVDSVPNNVVRAINICRNMMTHPKAREAFVKIAQKYATARQNVWFLHQKPPITTAQVTDIFLVMVKKTFPTVFIDYALKNPDYGRITLDAHGQKTSSPRISLFQSMECGRDDDLFLFQRCLFMTANNFFHEMGHVFVTWLSEGQMDTPPLINALALGPLDLENIGEAGRALEQYTFGGQVFYYRDPEWEEGDRCGPAYLRKPSGAIYRILPQLIKDVIRYNVQFPYGHEEKPEPDGTLRMLGDSMPADTFTDPWASKEMADYLKSSAQP